MVYTIEIFSPFDPDFNTSVKICPMIFWFVDASIYCTPIIFFFNKGYLMWETIHTWHSTCCLLYKYLTGWYTCLLGTHKLSITIHGISTSIIFSLFYLFSYGCFYVFQMQNINLGQPTPQELYPYICLLNFVFIIEGKLICNV